jgi:VanZ family protein
VVPKEYRPSSGLVSGAIEHFGAYGVLGLLGAVILRGQISWWALALCNTVLAGCLEVAQLWVPGRVANTIDFLASALGSLACILAVRALLRVWFR